MQDRPIKDAGVKVSTIDEIIPGSRHDPCQGAGKGQENSWSGPSARLQNTDMTRGVGSRDPGWILLVGEKRKDLLLWT